jgi:hypothetical protein
MCGVMNQRIPELLMLADDCMQRPLAIKTPLRQMSFETPPIDAPLWTSEEVRCPAELRNLWSITPPSGEH